MVTGMRLIPIRLVEVVKLPMHQKYHTITYYWTVPLILDYSYLVGNLSNSKIAETKALELLKS
jgi:hypothetical protein